MAETKKSMKLLNRVLIILEILVIGFLLTVAIITMVNSDKGQTSKQGFMGFINFLQFNPIWFFILIVFPLIAIFIYNVYLLFKNFNEKTERKVLSMTKEEMLEQAREQARKEVIEELERQKANKESK